MKKKNGRPTASGLIPPRDELVRQAIMLWNVYGPSWVTNVATYKALLEIKREKKIHPLGAIKKSELAKYPRIDFMEIKTEEKAREYLNTMNVEQIFRLINEIELALSSYAYVNVRNKITDYRAEIKRRENGVNIYAIDPDVKIPSRGKNLGKRGTLNPES